MKIIGITGGIGCGKSTVSRYLEEKGFYIVDADKIARRIVEPEDPDTVLPRLRELFGEEIVDSSGRLRRKALAEIVFNSPEEKKKMDDLMLGKIVGIIKSRAEECRKAPAGRKAVFLDVPLLFETDLHTITDENWLVDVADDLRIARVMERDGATRKQVEDRIRNQMPQEEKRKMATLVLDNDGDLKELYGEIDRELQRL